MFAKRPRPPRLSAAALALMVLVTAVVGVGCPCAGVGGDILDNLPQLRWWLFSNYGASRICPEMTKRGMGLRMSDRGPAIGRFFPNQCTIELNDATQTVIVNFAGTGYAYHPVSRRVGFSVNGSVEYRPDLRVTDEDVYVWGRVNRIVSGPSFRLGYVENPVADVVTAQTPLGEIANLFGNQIVAGELTRGFTVVQNIDTETKTFALGIVEPPFKPHTPFDTGKDEQHTFANETIDVAWNTRDFLGPFEVVDTDQVLLFRYVLTGPTVDVMVVARSVGDVWRDQYQLGTNGPPPGPTITGHPLAQGREERRSYRLAPGQYYVVIDNSQYAGQIAPPPTPPFNPFGGPAARISYVAQLGEL